MFVPDGAAPGLTSVGACAGVFDARGRGGARRAGRAARSRAPSVRLPPRWAAPARCAPVTALARRARQAVRRSAERRDRAATSNSPRARTTARSSTSSATPPPAWAPTRARPATSTRWCSWAQYTGQAPEAVGTTRFRPPFAPVTLGAIAGRRVGALYRPLKYLPGGGLASSHAARCSRASATGAGRPPTRARASRSSRRRSARRRTVRSSAGLFDGSPLGKLEVYRTGRGGAFSISCTSARCRRSPLGQARYGVLLNENGTLVDDGIVARLGARALLGQHHDRRRRAHRRPPSRNGCSASTRTSGCS